MSKTLRQILDLAMERGIMQEHGLTGTTKEQELDIYEQQILQWVNDEMVGEKPFAPEVAGDGFDSWKRGYLAAELDVWNDRRETLKQHGWKETK